MGQERTDPGVTGFLGLMAWEKSYEPAVGLPRHLRPAVPDATSQNLGWVGLQAFRYRNSAPNEVHWPPLSQHLAYFSKPVTSTTRHFRLLQKKQGIVTGWRGLGDTSN